MISNAPQNLFVNILKAGEEFFYFKSILTYNFTDFKIKNINTHTPLIILGPFYKIYNK